MDYISTRDRIHELLDPTIGGTKLDRVVNSCIIVLIVLNTIAVIVETVSEIYTPHKHFFTAFENFSITIFSIEYLLRVWTCTSVPRYKHPIYGRVKYIFSVSAIIDI